MSNKSHTIWKRKLHTIDFLEKVRYIITLGFGLVALVVNLLRFLRSQGALVLRMIGLVDICKVKTHTIKKECLI